MSQLVEVVFEIEDPSRFYARMGPSEVPTGIIAAIEVAGKRTQRLRFANFVVAHAELPAPVAEATWHYYDRHIAHTSVVDHNCLGYMASSQGWPVDHTELWAEVPPALLEGGYSEVRDVTRLEAGAPYGLPNDYNQLEHGIVGLAARDRHIGVHGMNPNEMRISPTTETVHGYLRQFATQRLVKLHGRNYISSEIA